ncbi:MAG: hypothetical protein R3C44_08895 [Chloroflexota bacterium]
MSDCRQKFAPMGLTLLSGVEMGNPHQHLPEATAFLNRFPMDVRIASLHWLYGENIHDPVCFEGRDPQTVYADYFLELRNLVSGFGPIDILAHFDRILWRGTLLGAPFDPLTLEPLVRDTLSTVAWRGIALELNMRLLDHTPNWRSALATMLSWFAEEGGRHVVVDSDAHHINQLGSNLDLAVEVLQEAGLRPARLSLAERDLA